MKKNSRNQKSIIADVENTLREKEFSMLAILDSSLLFSKSNPDSLFVKHPELADIKDNGFSLLIFRDDTLAYWSDIHLPASRFYDSVAFNNQMIRFGNGWYRVLQREKGHLIAVGLILIKNEYPFENDYLDNSFQADFTVPERTQVSFDLKQNVVKDGVDKPLFSLQFARNIQLSTKQALLLFFACLLGFLFFIAALFCFHRRLYSFFKSALLFIPAFIFDLALIRLAIFHLKIPGELYESVLFSPLYYASSEMLPSFADLAINSLLSLIAAFAFFRYLIYNQKVIRKMKSYLRIILAGLILTFNGFIFYYLTALVRGMVIDSVIPYTLNNVFNFNLYSIFGIIVMAMLCLAFVLFTLKLLELIVALTGRVGGYVLAYTGGIGLLLLLQYFYFPEQWFSFICFGVLVMGFWLLRARENKAFFFFRILFGLVLFSFISTYILHESNVQKEKDKRMSLAQKLSNSQDPIAEFLYKGVEKELLSDTLLARMAQDYPYSEIDIKDYIYSSYFRGYWDKYQVQITLCDQNDSLFIKPSMVNQSCHEYFDNLLTDIGKKTSNSSLYILNYGTGGNSYLSRTDFRIDSTSYLSTFIELYSKFIPKGLGYPELLIDKKIFLNTDLSNYSYARYRNGNLVDAYGKYYYSIRLEAADTSLHETTYYSLNDYDHLFYKIDDSSSLIISRKSTSWLGTIAPFSLMFLFFSVFIILFFIIVAFPYNHDLLKLNFKNRLQVSIIAIILISFILIGVFMSYYISNLNDKKNTETLSEKAMSILMEIQGKLADYEKLTPEMDEYVANWLVKFSNVFFTDINLFDREGNLISSSRPQIFNEGMIADRMDPTAYKELVFNKKTIFIHKERIGNLDYYSAYLPFYNNQNQLTAYLNLPYFARENELKQEMSTFMMTFINIYIFLIAIAIIIALFIAGRMTRPLKEIREKIGKVKLGGRNEKIYWPGRMDEIGDLVMEYNRMIDELSLSADLLAKSERESAWREMAKQVAHEIKNPLTPMKLSVQYLEKAWKDKAPDWEAKLQRFTKTLIEQIETLSSIASAFSDFAKMPKSEMTALDLTEVINSTLIVFSGNKTRIVFNQKDTGAYNVMADRKQLLRVMNNLVTNAIQAIDQASEGIIEISLERRNQKIIVSVKDNGRGITEEQKAQIFIPNFSTKSEGMGLGLAMVKNIIEGHGGTIWFLSRENEGATFFFELPDAETEESE